MTAFVYLAEIYKSFVGSSTEAKRNRTLSPFQRTNFRQSAVSLLHFTLIRYSQLRATKYNRIQPNSPRLPLPREHANATTKAYAKPRDWSVEVGGDKRKPYQPYSTASVDSQGDGVWVSLCAPRVVAAFDRSRYNQSERAKSFLLSSHLNLKWIPIPMKFLREIPSSKEKKIASLFLQLKINKIS